MNDAQTRQKGKLPEEIDLLELLRVLLRKLHWLILAGLVCGLAAFLITYFLIAPTYQSTASFYVYTKTVEAASGTDVNGGTIQNADLQAAESLASTYTKIMESNSALDAALAELKQKGIDLTRKELSEMVEVSAVSDTQLISLTVTSTSAKEACAIANALIEVAPTEIIRITKAGGIEMVDNPEVATEKSSPSTVKNVALGALAGLFISAAIIILKSLSDATIYVPDDLKKLTEATVLGQIPEINAAEQTGNSWATVTQGVIRYE